MLDTADTIAAIASAREGALRGIVRVSGPDAVTCLARVFKPDEPLELEQLKTPIVLAGAVHTAPPIGLVPCDVYVWPDLRSYTRQPAFEIHTFGSLPILEAVLAALCQSGSRLAAPGEFTMRAFLAGRLDLTQAEAVLGVIDARGETELDIALHQLAGGLARPLHKLREQLLDVLAHLEAGLDFVEEDIEFITTRELEHQLAEIYDAIAAIVQQMTERVHAVGEPRVVLYGWPNVGKSSLFNALTGAPAAIVSDLAGTTRDYVTRRTSLNGREILLVDTAGIELNASDGVTAASQIVTRDQSQQASVGVLCLDASRPLNDWERHELADKSVVPRVVVLTKCDAELRSDFDGEGIRTSCWSKIGLRALRDAITARLEESDASSSWVASTAVRCQASLRNAALSLQQARSLAVNGQGDELIAAELRIALDDLGSVVGAVYTDDILDRIFSRFCIGK